MCQQDKPCEFLDKTIHASKGSIERTMSVECTIILMFDGMGMYVKEVLNKTRFLSQPSINETFFPPILCIRCPGTAKRSTGLASHVCRVDPPLMKNLVEVDIGLGRLWAAPGKNKKTKDGK